MPRKPKIPGNGIKAQKKIRRRDFPRALVQMQANYWQNLRCGNNNTKVFHLPFCQPFVSHSRQTSCRAAALPAKWIQFQKSPRRKFLDGFDENTQVQISRKRF